jgi:hypothetical protein
VGDGFESVYRTLGDPLGGGIGCDQSGIFGFELSEFGEQLVVLAVGDFGSIVHIIQHIMPPNLGSQLLDLFFYVVFHVDSADNHPYYTFKTY